MLIVKSNPGTESDEDVAARWLREEVRAWDPMVLRHHDHIAEGLAGWCGCPLEFETGVNDRKAGR